MEGTVPPHAILNIIPDCGWTSKTVVNTLETLCNTTVTNIDILPIIALNNTN